jgi:hypothetical protein
MNAIDAKSRAFVVHLTPHRIRIKIPQRERQDAYFAAVARVLETRPDVACVHVNALVASIVIHCRDGFEITSVRDCFMGLELVLPAPGWPVSQRARQIASQQDIHGGSRNSSSLDSVCLVSLVVKLTIAIATGRFEALIREWVVEAVVRVLLPRLYRKPIPRLEAPRTLLVATVA